MTRSSARVLALAAIAAVVLRLVARAGDAPDAGGPWTGTSLTDALARLQATGLGIIYSSELVKPEMHVRGEPRSRAPREILEEILRPWGLVAAPGPAGSLLVTRSDRAVAPPSFGRIQGHVRSGPGNAPVERAEVSVVGTRVATSSFSDGSFSTRLLPAGTYVLEVSADGFVAARTEDVRIAAGEIARVNFDLSPVPRSEEQITVAPSLVQIRRAQPESTQVLSRREVERAPHIFDDPFRAVTHLPGTTPGDISIPFHIRGGEQDGLLFLLDGQELYHPYHFKDFFDIFSIIDPQAIGAIDFSTGGFPAHYGSRLSGVLDLTPNPTSRSRRTSVGVSLMSVNLFSEDAFAGERGHWMGSARLGFLKYALNLLEPDETDLDPRYYDAFVRGQYSASPSISLFGNLLAAQDDIRQHASDKVQNLDSTTRDLYGWVGADTVVGSTLFAQTIASAGRLTRERRGNFENSGVVGNVADVRSFRFAGGSQTWTARVSDSNEARFGLAGKHVSAAYEYDSRREIQVPSNPPPPIVRHLEPDPSGTDLSVWGSDRVRLFPNVTMELGLRWDHQTWAGSGDWSPRANVVWAVGPTTTLRGAWGLFTQPQRVDELQVEDGQTEFHRAERAEHRILSVDQILGAGWSVRIEGYQKKVDHVRPRFQNLFTKFDLFPELLLDRVLVPPDRVDARGVELLVRREGTGPISWWASYTRALSRDTIEGGTYPTSWDQPHSIHLNVNYRAGERWNVGAAWVWHSGWPITGVRTEPITLPDGSPGIGLTTTRFNSERLPPYHRLDLRLSHQFPLGRGNVRAYVEVTNLYNRRNPCCVSTFGLDQTTSPPRVIRIYDYWIQTLPTFGIQWSF